MTGVQTCALPIFKKVFNKDDVQIQGKNDVVADKTLLNTRKDFDYLVPDYETMISEMKDWIINHKQLYGRYKV